MAMIPTLRERTMTMSAKRTVFIKTKMTRTMQLQSSQASMATRTVSSLSPLTLAQ